MAGYSGTPLIKKLGLKPGHVAQFIGAPPGYFKLLGAMPEGVRVRNSPTRGRRGELERGARNGGLDFIQLFVRERTELEKLLPRLMTQITPTGMIWVSWPKKASGLATTITDNVISEIALPLGLVDIKVCAVDEVWSGLKLVVQARNR